MIHKNFDITGLSDKEVLQSRKQHGANRLDYKRTNPFLEALIDVGKEPMVILLIIASSIYFLLGETGDGFFLLSAIIIVAFISLYQDSRSRKALENLKSLTQPHCKVIREGLVSEIPSEELVIGDFIIIEEGTLIAADGKVVQAHDFSVNESILTGESQSVYKNDTEGDNLIYSGTTVVSGMAVAEITSIGHETQLGRIGKSLASISEEKTPLEIQIHSFVKKMVFIGAAVFLLVWVVNFYQSHQFLDSLLQALTMAMSILPEEIPVAFTTFMALGAWRLMKLGIVVKQMNTVETLGSATVICTDKTGTITENRMELTQLYLFSSKQLMCIADDKIDEEAQNLLTAAMWASEPTPFDPMEVALHEAYAQLDTTDERPQYKLVHEYPLEGKPPMMTHIFENASGERIIAAKGAPEALLAVSKLSEAAQEEVQQAIRSLANKGYRVLGVGQAHWDERPFPSQQQDFLFQLKGLVAFYDPPKANIQQVFQDFYAAGLRVKIITGDNAITTCALAKQVGFIGGDHYLNGEALMALSDDALQTKVMDINIFTRMFPEAKLRVINALKKQQQVVAMTGDGVNDAPALKAAHIGIAMGKKGTETAKQAASLVLIEDDLSKMIEAVAMGRKIYANLKKAIQYIISIHIPIIGTVSIPLLLDWTYPNIFYPVQVIFLELIMGPTCSIIYENEPIEKNTMHQRPRPFSSTFFNSIELATSILQGLFITIGALTSYQYAVHQGYGEDLTRSMVFTTLIMANIFLTLVNRSFYYSILTTLTYKNRLIAYIIMTTLLLLGVMLYTPKVNSFFDLQALSMSQLLTCVSIGAISVIWYEGVKAVKRTKVKNNMNYQQ